MKNRPFRQPLGFALAGIRAVWRRENSFADAARARAAAAIRTRTTSPCTPRTRRPARLLARFASGLVGG